tara:strand:- start:2654 stop:3526 length:873 start_codon:yes stop_codon:yes gene_type:complete
MDSYSGSDASLKSYNTVNLRLSTAYKTSSSASDTNCTIQLTQSRLLTNVVKADVNYVNIANVFHNVASYNNKFEISIYDISVGPPVQQYSLEMPRGYYNATELAAVLQAGLRAIDTRLAATTIVYDTVIKRYITATNNSQYFCDLEAFSGNANKFGNNFLWLIGANVNTNVYRIGVGETITPFPTNLYGATSVFLCSRKLATTKSIFELIDNTDRVSSTVGNEVMAIGINSAYGVYQTYYNNGSDRGLNCFNTGFILDEVDLQIVDEWNNFLESDRPLNPIVIGVKLTYI